ncbi:MAG: hypothetical protein R3E10_10970 [Gemmatimonadota bacterium]
MPTAIVRTQALPLAALTPLVLLAACAGGRAPGSSGPAPTESTLRIGSSGRIEMRTEVSVGERSFGVPADGVWEVLPEVFEHLDVPVTIQDRAALQTGNAGYLARRVEGKRLSTYLDCGISLSGVLADVYDVTLQLLVQLRPTGASDTDVVVTIDGLAEPRSTSGTPVHCTSKKVLEERFTELVAEALLARIPRA